MRPCREGRNGILPHFGHKFAEVPSDASAMRKADQIRTRATLEMLTALEHARRAITELESAGYDMTDAQLARSPSYARLLRAGMALSRCGGGDAIEWARQNLFPESSARTARVCKLLDHWWAGLDQWSAPGAAQRDQRGFSPFMH